MLVPVVERDEVGRETIILVEVPDPPVAEPEVEEVDE